MKKSINPYLKKLIAPPKMRSPNLSQTGFTLVEMIIVIVIVGILGAIAVPSWANFIEGRRANAVNESVLQTLKQAQGEAKKNKISYNVAFRTISQVPQVAVYRIGSSTIPWGNLVKDPGIKPGQVLLGTNITGANTVSTTTITYASATPITITFDQNGSLLPSNSGLVNSVLAVGVPTTTGSTTVLESTRRCVKISTLLGAMQTKQKSDCNPNL